MKKFLRSCMTNILSLLPIKKRILLESHPDLTGNTYQVFQKMLNNNLNKKYELVWYVLDVEKYKHINIENVYFKNHNPKSKIEKLKKMIYTSQASVIVDENRMIPKVNKSTKRIFLNHGTLLKNIKGIYGPSKNVDHVIISSEEIIDKYIDCFGITEQQIEVLGSPRNDVLLRYNDFEWSEIIPDYTGEKVVIWMPTFRQHKVARVDTDKNLPLGLPIIYSLEELININNYAKSKGILILLKVHPAQDLSYLAIESLSNIKVLLNEKIATVNKELYEILPHTDALITDYSSIYFDYLLLDKPIGLTNDDIDAYKLGFVYEDIENVLVGHQITNSMDLKSFIDDVANGKDTYSELRKKVNDKFNTFQDNRSAERVCKLIENYLNQS